MYHLKATLHDENFGLQNSLFFCNYILALLHFVLFIPIYLYFVFGDIVYFFAFLSLFFFIPTFVLDIVVLVFLLSRGISENNKYKKEVCYSDDKDNKNQSSCCCKCDKKDEIQAKDNKSDNNTDSISQE